MTQTEKPAFLVVCGAMTADGIDPEYAKRAGPAALEAGLTPIGGGAMGLQVEVLEGQLPEDTMFLAIEQFPSMDALKAFYHSEAYQRAIPFRDNGVKINFLAAVDGISAAELSARTKAAE